METTQRKLARRHEREFKESAVALVPGGKRATDVPRDAGVSHRSLTARNSLFAPARPVRREAGSRGGIHPHFAAYDECALATAFGTLFVTHAPKVSS